VPPITTPSPRIARLSSVFFQRPAPRGDRSRLENRHMAPRLEVLETHPPRIRQDDKKWPVREGWFFAYLREVDLPELDRTIIPSSTKNKDL
jgi:hypothetical protein